MERNARAASVPDIYTYYLPQASSVASLRVMPAPVMAPAVKPTTVQVPGQVQTADLRQEPLEPGGSARTKPASRAHDDIIRSGIAVGRLIEESAGLTYSLAEVERLVNEAMQSSAADIPVIVSAKTGRMAQSPEEGVEYIERPAPEVIVKEKPPS